MAIPQFNKMGLLDKGIYPCTALEFIQRFCYDEGAVRKRYKEVLEQLFAFSVNQGVSSIIIAGSFVTNKKEPNDLDCIVIFPSEKSIHMQIDELLIVEGCELDIMSVAESNKEFIYSLMDMFSLNKYEISVGMVEVILNEEKDRSTWNDYDDYNSVQKLLEAREAYIHRNVMRGTAKKKVLVTICNADEYLLWNYDIAHIVSSSGWIFAPYIYYPKDVENVVESFKSWLITIYYTYETDLCVFADGLGTYLLGKHFKDDSVCRRISFDKIILSKTVLNPEFDWEEVFYSSYVQLIINMRDVNKNCKRNENIMRSISKDALYGDACKLGFNKKYQKLIEYDYKYTDTVRVDEFKNNILPMFHISEALVDNTDRETRNNLDEIISIMNKEINIRDILL